MSTVLGETPHPTTRPRKRRLRQYYVRVKDQTFAVWAHSRDRAEEVAHDHFASLR